MSEIKEYKSKEYGHLQEYKYEKTHLSITHWVDKNFIEISYWNGISVPGMDVENTIVGYFENSQEVFEDLINNKQRRIESYFFGINQGQHKFSMSCYGHDLPESVIKEIDAKIVDNPNYFVFIKDEKGIVRSIEPRVVNHQYFSKYCVYKDIETDYEEQFKKIDALKDQFTSDQLSGFRKIIKETTPHLNLLNKNIEFIKEGVKSLGLTHFYSLSMYDLPDLCGYPFTKRPILRGNDNSNLNLFAE